MLVRNVQVRDVKVRSDQLPKNTDRRVLKMKHLQPKCCFIKFDIQAQPKTDELL